MSYVVLGCGAIGATVAACLARDGHDVLVSDPDPAVVAAVRAGGLRVEGPAGSFTVAVPATAPDDLPPRLAGPVLVAVRARDMAAAAALLAARLDGAGYVVCLRHGQDAGLLAGAIGPGRVAAAWADFDATELGPGVVRVGDRATLLVGELDNLNTERAGLLASHIAGAQLTERILGCLQSGLAQDAVLAVTGLSDQPAAASWAIRATGRCCSRWRGRCWPGRRCRRRRPAASTPPTCPVRSPGSSRPAGGPPARTPRSTWTWRCGTARPTCPPLPVGEAAPCWPGPASSSRAVEQGRRSCSPSNLDLLAAHERLERLGRPLNAVCSAIGAPDRARTGPLAGRPVGVKDIIAVAGVPTRCGSPASDPRPAAADAVLVRRLREAGAEVFATTQCLEYAAGFAHPEVGDTRNPRDPSRTSGGSSGGSAALVAAEVCDLALGTDTGGSVRIPAAYCGVVGLKPSYGLLPLDGVFPLSPSCDHAGTLTATVAGAADLLAVLAEPGPLRLLRTPLAP